MDRLRVRPRLRRVPAPRRPLCRRVRPQARARVGPRRADHRLGARRRRRRRHAPDRRPLRQGRERGIHRSRRALDPHDLVRGRAPPQQGARRLHGCGRVRIHVRPRRGRAADPAELALTFAVVVPAGVALLLATLRVVRRDERDSEPTPPPRPRRRTDGHRRFARLRPRSRQRPDERLAVARDDWESRRSRPFSPGRSSPSNGPSSSHSSGSGFFAPRHSSARTRARCFCSAVRRPSTSSTRSTLQDVLGWGPLETGIVFMAASITTGLVAPHVGALATRIGPTWVVLAGAWRCSAPT